MKRTIITAALAVGLTIAGIASAAATTLPPRPPFNPPVVQLPPSEQPTAPPVFKINPNGPSGPVFTSPTTGLPALPTSGSPTAPVLKPPANPIYVAPVAERGSTW